MRSFPFFEYSPISTHCNTCNFLDNTLLLIFPLISTLSCCRQSHSFHSLRQSSASHWPAKRTNSLFHPTCLHIPPSFESEHGSHHTSQTHSFIQDQNCLFGFVSITLKLLQDEALNYNPNLDSPMCNHSCANILRLRPSEQNMPCKHCPWQGQLHDQLPGTSNELECLEHYCRKSCIWHRRS